MPLPELTDAAGQLYEAAGGDLSDSRHRGLAGLDPENDYAFAKVCQVLAKALDPVNELVRDRGDDRPPLAIIFDPDLCPAALLPWLAQVAGVRLPPRLSEADQRAEIKAARNRLRGTPTAVIDTAKRSLTGTQAVYLIERHGSAWRYTVTTLDAETPEPDRTFADLLRRKPVGYRMAHSTIVGGDYETLRDTHVDYAELEADFADYQAMRDNPAQT